MSTKKTTQLDCSVAKVLDVLGDYWMILIIRDLMLFKGVRRFESLREALDISRNILTERLRVLVERGVVKRVPISAGARRMEYRLTRKGWELMPIIMSMAYWSIKWREDEDPENYAFVDIKNKKPVKSSTVMSEDGRILGPADIEVVPLTDSAKRYLGTF